MDYKSSSGYDYDYGDDEGNKNDDYDGKWNEFVLGMIT